LSSIPRILLAIMIIGILLCPTVSAGPEDYSVELREIWVSWDVEGNDYDREDLSKARVGTFVEIYDTWQNDPPEYVYPFPQSQLQATFTCYVCYIDDDQVVRVPYEGSTLSGVWYYSNIIWHEYGQWIEDFDLTLSADGFRTVTYHIDSLYMQQYSLTVFVLPEDPPCPSDATLTTVNHWPSIARDPGEFYQDAEILEKIIGLYDQLTEESRGAFYGWSRMLRDRVSYLEAFIAEVRPTLTDMNAKAALEASSQMAEQAAELLDLARSSAVAGDPLGRLKQITRSAWLSYETSIIYGDASGYYEAGDYDTASELYAMAEELTPQADSSYEAAMAGEWGDSMIPEELRPLAAFLAGLAAFLLVLWILLPLRLLRKRRIWNVIAVGSSTAAALGVAYLLCEVIL